MAEIFRTSLYGPWLRIEDGFLYYEGSSSQPFAVPMDKFGSAVSQHDGNGNVLRILDANGIELARGHVPDDWFPAAMEWLNNNAQDGKPGGTSALHQLPPPPADFTGRAKELDELLPRLSSGGVTISGLFSVDLDVLPPEDARALLLAIAPRIGDRAGALAEWCGYLPLALRLAASALANNRDLKVDDYLARLSDAQKRLELVEASLSLSYDLLLPERQGLFAALAAFPDNFDVPAAAAVWDIEQDPAGEALSGLVAASLVEWPQVLSRAEGDAATGRYRLHDLVRDFADDRLTPEARAAAARRHAGHYLNVAAACDELYLSGHQAPALALFDLEWGNIQAGQAWAAAHAAQAEGAAELCSSYPGSAVYCLYLRQHVREWVRWLEAARRLKNRQAEGADLGNLGNAYAALGETRRAIEHHEQALAIDREIGDRRGVGQVVRNLGLAYTALGEPRRAIELYEQQLVITREIGDRRGEGQAVGNLGLAYAALGETRRAIELYEQALVVAREIDDCRGEGADLGNLGNAYADLGEPRRAIEHYEQALVIAREIGDRLGEGEDSWNLGLALEREGDLAGAAAAMQVYVDYERELGHPDAEKHAAQLAEVRARLKG